MDQLTQNVNDLQLDSSQDGNWETVTKKNKNKDVSGCPKIWGTHVPSDGWEDPNRGQRLCMVANNGSGKPANSGWKNRNAEHCRAAGSEARPSSNIATGHPICAPLEHGWKWAALSGTTSAKSTAHHVVCYNEKNDEDGDDDDDENSYSEDDDDLVSDDDFDSDVSQNSHGSRKKHRMLKGFFDTLDKLTNEDLNEPERQWHCPACQGGPGAIDWYIGLQPLMTHAKSKGSKRVKLHREFAQLLDGELSTRGMSVTKSGEMSGQWEGLKQEVKDHEIVWPPMVIIMNTRLEKDENDKLIGIGNQELLHYFNDYAPVRARNSYGPQGHRGMSVLIFEDSAVGYSEAKRLHIRFEEQGTGRDAWDSKRAPLFLGGRRQLFGFMAKKEDLDFFNQHSRGKSQVKYNMRSYQEKVVSQMRQMKEDNQELIYLKNKVVREKMKNDALVASNAILRESMRNLNSENRIVRQRSRMQHDQDKEQMDYLDNFHKDRMQEISEATHEKEDCFELLQQQERKKMEETTKHAAIAEDYNRRNDVLARFIELQDQEVEEFVSRRAELEKMHVEKKLAMKERHYDEELELEKTFDAQLTELMKNYIPDSNATEEAVSSTYLSYARKCLQKETGK